MIRKSQVTADTLRDIAASRAPEIGSIAATIEKENRLLIVIQRLADCTLQRAAEDRAGRQRPGLVGRLAVRMRSRNASSNNGLLG